MVKPRKAFAFAFFFFFFFFGKKENRIKKLKPTQKRTYFFYRARPLKTKSIKCFNKRETEWSTYKNARSSEV